MKRNFVLVIISLVLLLLLAGGIFLFTKYRLPDDLSTASGQADASDDLLADVDILDLIDAGNGCYTVKYKYTITNIGTSLIYDITASTDLSATFAPHFFQITGFTSDYFALNPNFNGTTDKNLIAPPGTLSPGQSAHFYLDVYFCPGDDTGPFHNEVITHGKKDSPTGTPVVTITITASPTPRPSRSPRPSPTITPAPSATIGATPSVSVSPTIGASNTPVPTVLPSIIISTEPGVPKDDDDPNQDEIEFDLGRGSAGPTDTPTSTPTPSGGLANGGADIIPTMVIGITLLSTSVIVFFFDRKRSLES